MKTFQATITIKAETLSDCLERLEDDDNPIDSFEDVKEVFDEPKMCYRCGGEATRKLEDGTPLCDEIDCMLDYIYERTDEVYEVDDDD